MWIVSVVALCIVMALCVLGTFGRWYSDNLAQRIGMAMLFIGCWPKVEELMFFRPENGGVWVAHVGLAVFAMGTAWKVWLHRDHHPPPAQPPHRLHRDHLRHVSGGKG